MPNTTPHAAITVTDEDVKRALDAYWAAAPIGMVTPASVRVILEADRAALASARPREEPTDAARALMDVRHIAASSPLRVTHPHLCGALDSIILRIDAHPTASARPQGAEEDDPAKVGDPVTVYCDARGAIGRGSYAGRITTVHKPGFASFVFDRDGEEWTGQFQPIRRDASGLWVSYDRGELDDERPTATPDGPDA